MGHGVAHFVRKGKSVGRRHNASAGIIARIIGLVTIGLAALFLHVAFSAMFKCARDQAGLCMLGELLIGILFIGFLRCGLFIDKTGPEIKVA
jgi:hypothetical protein